MRGADMRAVARGLPYADVGGALCGCGICALSRAEGRGGGLCHTAGDMRAERAEMGCTGAEIEGRCAAGEEI